MTKSQINRLGDKLRLSATPDEAALSALQEFRASHNEPMARAQALLRDQLGIETTSRLKTINTIIEKLRRERTRLATMQDIAGLRIVRQMSLAEQDILVGRIRDLFVASRVDDRRARPSHGYRAVHIIAMVDEHPVEIQVRTEVQDKWAQAMEALADELGRGIRYGEMPSPTATNKMAVMVMMSELFALHESYDPVSGVGREELRAKIMQLLHLLEAVKEREGDAS